MTKRSVSVLLAAGILLAAMYILIYFKGPSDGVTGAFSAAPTFGHAIFAAVIAVLALVAFWQSKARKK